MISGNENEARIYNGGLITNFTMFDHWDEQNVPDEWLKMSEITELQELINDGEWCIDFNNYPS